MNRVTAASIADVFKRFGHRPAESYSITRVRAGRPLQSFHGFADGKPLISADRVTAQNRRTLILLLIDWAANGEYLLVVYPEDRSSVLAEISKIEHAAGARNLLWRYRPTKHDGRNDRRRSYFRRHVGDLRMSLTIPITAAGVPRFLDD